MAEFSLRVKKQLRDSRRDVPNTYGYAQSFGRGDGRSATRRRAVPGAGEWAAPPSGSSSRLTLVITACRTPMRRTASAVLAGSSNQSPMRPPRGNKLQLRLEPMPQCLK